MLRIQLISACTLLLVTVGGCNDGSKSAFSSDAQRPAAGEPKVTAASDQSAKATPAQDKTPPTQPADQALPDPLRGTVKETMDAGGYTYVLLATSHGEHWAAAKRFPVAVGNEVEVAGLMPMVNFPSPSLKRTFENILFVGRANVVGGDAPADSVAPSPADALPPGHPAIGGEGNAEAAAPAQPSGLPSGHPAINGAAPGAGAVMPPVAGEIEVHPGSVTVAELFDKKADLAGKSVTFSGRVVKANRGILGVNWLHVQDGTGEVGTNDITVTSVAGYAEPGSVVLIQGILALDRDFGSGYKYGVIVENATVSVQPSKNDTP